MYSNLKMKKYRYSSVSITALLILSIFIIVGEPAPQRGILRGYWEAIERLFRYLYICNE